MAFGRSLLCLFPFVSFATAIQLKAAFKVCYGILGEEGHTQCIMSNALHITLSPFATHSFPEEVRGSLAYSVWLLPFSLLSVS